MRTTLLGIATSIALLYGCGQPPAEEGAAPTTATATERWEANAATKEGIAGMRRLITAYDAASAPAGALRDSLEDRMGLIFERCTMEGEAHMALHDYLLPLITQFKELQEHPTPAQLDSLTSYLRTFDQKFR